MARTSAVGGCSTENSPAAGGGLAGRIRRPAAVVGRGSVKPMDDWVVEYSSVENSWAESSSAESSSAENSWAESRSAERSLAESN